MDKKNSKIDIRIIKYKSYIKKFPEKAYGFYCLGRLNLDLGNFKDAEVYFKKSLLLNSKYVRSKIGLIECYLNKNRLLLAANYFRKNSIDFSAKKIYLIKLTRAISNHFDKNTFKTTQKKILPLLIFNHAMKSLTSMFNSNSESVVVDLFLCINYLHSNSNSEKAFVLYNICVSMYGLNDNMRWKIVQILAKENPTIYKDDIIASKFECIPLNDCISDYANLIFASSLRSKNITKVKNIFNYIKKSDKPILTSNIWRYIEWCISNSVYDKDLYFSCSRLLNLGWMDKLIAETIYKLKDLAVVDNIEKEVNLLRLFGYER